MHKNKYVPFLLISGKRSGNDGQLERVKVFLCLFAPVRVQFLDNHFTRDSHSRLKLLKAFPSTSNLLHKPSKLQLITNDFHDSNKTNLEIRNWALGLQWNIKFLTIYNPKRFVKFSMPLALLQKSSYDLNFLYVVDLAKSRYASFHNEPQAHSNLLVANIPSSFQCPSNIEQLFTLLLLVLVNPFVI